MSNPWFRMYAEFMTDPKVQMLSESDQRRYIMLLCARCSNGDVTLHDNEVAFLLRVTDEEYARTKATLMAKMLIDEHNHPIAWDKRQYTSDSSAARVAAHRERKKQACNVTVTPPDTDTDTDTDNNIPPFNPPPSPPAQATPTEERPVKSRGTRLSADWELPDDWLAWAIGEWPAWSSRDVYRIAEKFRDYWTAKTGRDATKADWSATWRNWVRREVEQHGKRSGNSCQKLTPLERVRAANRLAFGDGIELPAPTHGATLGANDGVVWSVVD